MNFEDRLNKRLTTQKYEHLGSDIDELGEIGQTSVGAELKPSRPPRPTTPPPAPGMGNPGSPRTYDQFRADDDMNREFDREAAIAKTEEQINNPNLTPEARRLLNNKLVILKRESRLESGKCATCSKSAFKCTCIANLPQEPDDRRSYNGPINNITRRNEDIARRRWDPKWVGDSDLYGNSDDEWSDEL